ncbi:MAG TPA: lipopolysaccharide kinase InaA family protein [Sedimentisphaerales bacterium]|nr:lipopolysaccharide kinase InaA family protein [Sedimentisphaerales bacterium]
MTALSTHPANRQDSVRESPSFFVTGRFAEAFAKLGLTSLDAVFAFDSGRDLVKLNIGRFRRRVQFEATPAGSRQPVKVFLKRYDRPPIGRQIRNWLLHRRRRSFASVEREAIEDLAAAGVGAPRIAACGEQWGILFERRSFLMTEEIHDSQSLERRLPPCFDDPAALRARREFIRRLASFIKRFHATGRRHRDLYLSHVFCSGAGEFCLIDLARASHPILQRRFQVKDLAQLHYSCPARHFSRTDRVRFYLAYAGHRRLEPQDKAFLRAILRKTASMTRHNIKHGAVPPFLERTGGER